MGTFFDDASLVMIPSGVKDGKVYSIKPTDGSGDFTFSRGTDTATRVNSSGLIEKERENQLLQSNTFDTTWIASNATITSGHSGYDGSSDAWLLSKTGTAYGSVYQTGIIATNGGVYSFSIYAKANTTNFASFRLSTGSGADNRIKFNLTNGAISLASANNGTRIDAIATDVGNGWYRCSITAQANSTTITVNLYAGDTADTTGSVYVQDAQLEQGLVATAPAIETTTAAVYEGITDNLPRLDYSGGASCPSLLLEPSRTNVVEYAEYFDIYTKSNATITNNNSNSPEGVQNATSLSGNGATSSHYIYRNSGTAVSGTDYTISFFAKSGSLDYVQIVMGSGAFGVLHQNFDLSNGTIGSSSGSVTPFIEAYTDNWYRVGITITATASTTITPFIALANSSTMLRLASFATSSDVKIYGLQIEAGSYPTSYIPTYGTSASRAKDFINQNIQALTSGLTEGTLFIEFEKPNTGENNDVMRLRGSGTLGRAYIYNNGVGFASDWGTSQTFTIGENTKAAWRLDSLSSGVEFVNGVKGVGGSGTAWSDIRLLRFNADGNGGVLKIKQILFFPTALTDAECITLTTL